MLRNIGAHSIEGKVELVMGSTMKVMIMPTLVLPRTTDEFIREASEDLWDALPLFLALHSSSEATGLIFLRDAIPRSPHFLKKSIELRCQMPELEIVLGALKESNRSSRRSPIGSGKSSIPSRSRHIVG